MTNAIEVKELNHCYGKNKVLDGVNFKIREGTIFGLLGPSGAGKTTLINILTGQSKATNGESFICGTKSEDITGEKYKQIGIMMDNLGLYERMSVYDNLKFYQMLNKDSTERIDAVLKQVGLLQAKKTLTMNLSKGMTNRLAFARAILRKPKLLFLDEPTSGLDPSTVEEIHKMILEEKKKGTTVFLTTHNMHEAEKLCDEIALLNQGKIVEYGTPQDICRRYNHQKKIMVHLKDGKDVVLEHNEKSGEKIKTYLENNEIQTIHSTEPNLETVFIELTGKKFEG